MLFKIYIDPINQCSVSAIKDFSYDRYDSKFISLDQHIRVQWANNSVDSKFKWRVASIIFY